MNAVVLAGGPQDDVARLQPGAPQDGPGGGDPIAHAVRRIHDGSGYGPIWRSIVALAGLAPTILGLSGVVIWLKRERTATRMR